MATSTHLPDAALNSYPKEPNVTFRKLSARL